MQDKKNTYCYKKNLDTFIVCIVKKCLLNIPGLEILSSVDNEGRKYLKIDLFMVLSDRSQIGPIDIYNREGPGTQKSLNGKIGEILLEMH